MLRRHRLQEKLKEDYHNFYLTCNFTLARLFKLIGILTLQFFTFWFYISASTFWKPSENFIFYQVSYHQNPKVYGYPTSESYERI
jgi:hypothetical protein